MEMTITIYLKIPNMLIPDISLIYLTFLWCFSFLIF